MTDSEPPGGLPTWSREHAAVAVSGLVAAATVLRLTQVSRGSADTARAVLAYEGTATVLLGTVMLLVPILVTYAAAVLVVTVVVSGRLTRLLQVVLLSVLVVLATAGLALVLLMSAVVVGTYFLPRRLTGEDRSPRRVVTHLVDSAGMPLVLGLLLVGDHVWLPVARVEAPGRDPVVGYVLDETPERVVVLRDSDREVVRVDGAGASVAVCALPVRQLFDDWLVRPPLYLFAERPTYPDCG